MARIIDAYRRPSPIAEALKNATNSLFGDTLTPALRREQLAQATGKREAIESLQDTLGPVAGTALRAGADPGKINLLHTAMQPGFDPLAPSTTAAQLGSGMATGSSAFGFLRDQDRRAVQAAATLAEQQRAAMARDQTARFGIQTEADTRLTGFGIADQRARDEFSSKPIEAVDQATGRRVFVPQGQAAASGFAPIVNQSQARAGLLDSELAAGRVDPLGVSVAAGTAPSNAQATAQDTLAAAAQRDAAVLGEMMRTLPPDMRLKFGDSVMAADTLAQQAFGQFLLDSEADPTVFQRLTPENVGRILPGMTPAEAQEVLGWLSQQPGTTRAGIGQEVGKLARTAPQEAPPAVKRFRDPVSGEAFSSVDGGRTDMNTGAPIPSTAHPSGTIGVSASSPEEAGLRPTATNATSAFDQAQSLRNFNVVMDATRQVAAADPTLFGAAGLARRGVAAVRDTARSFDAMFGGQEGAFEQQIDAALADPTVDPGLRQKLAAAFDPNLSNIDRLSTLLAYQAASAVAGQTGRGLSDRDLQMFVNIIGDPTSLFSSQDKFMAGLDTLEHLTRSLLDSNRLLRAGDVDTPVSPPTVASPPVAQDVDPALFKYMTPEERALFQ